ncbi:MAG: serine/threonine-protein kinase, partial [Aureliella sp.]
EKLHRAGTTGDGPVSKNNDTTVAEGISQKTISLSQLPCSLGYFLLIKQIGQGGMGRVYNAVDLRSAAHVAVKVIHRTDSWSVYRFIEEFTWLSTLNHPNVIKLYDTFSEGDLRYFSMELVEGQPIHHWFQRLKGDDRWSRLRRVLSQAALAVAFLHDHDVIHRDIKSSNLMITGRGRAVLLDLGLANRADDEPASMQLLDGQHLVGTISYLSPEVLNGGPTTFASDWYSFGVMMYEVITGSFPMMKVDMQAPEGSRERYWLDLDASQEKLRDCPPDLASLCLEMLNASAVLRPQAADIVRRLGSDVGHPIPFAVRDTDFVGREEGLAFLEQALQTLHQGAPALRLIRGDSGMGKTAMLNRWAKQHLSGRNTMWLGIRCHSQDHTPLRALNLLVQELVTCLSRMRSDFWQDLMRGGEEIVYTFPQMERLTGGAWPAPSRTGDSMEGGARRSAGLHALLGWLKGLSRRINLVITIDDAHWADKESGRVLSHLIRAGEEFQGLIIAVDQGEEVASPLVQTLTENGQLAVAPEHIYEMPPLTRDECTRLLECWCERAKIALHVEVADDILGRSKGSPFLLQELLRSYMNYIVRHRLSDDTWLSGGQKEAGVLHNRFSMLPPTTEKVLQFIAVSPQPLGIHQLQTASRILPAALLAELNHLSGQGWIRLNGTTLDSEVEISHERFREV